MYMQRIREKRRNEIRIEYGIKQIAKIMKERSKRMMRNLRWTGICIFIERYFFNF